MRNRHMAVVLGALALTLMATGFADASTSSAPSLSDAASGPRLAVAQGASCYQQLEHDGGNYVVSDKFIEPELATYGSRGADDFKLTKSCIVRSIDIVGYYGATGGPADSENLVIYRDVDRRPGAVLTRQTVVGTDLNGSFHLELKRPVRLIPGSYWLSVQANTSYYEAGLWGWEVTTDITGTAALWKNPGDGFATGCTTYTDMVSCIGDPGGSDFMFAINRSR